ncbi:DMT family transporter [Chromatiaceae bacterium AAb-1]|nr:DMT family transporter [Chromatiaceae bacterium AAb-1]
MQAWRNAFQKQLSKDVNALGVTLARFIWAWPFAALYVFGLYQWQPADIPDFSLSFVMYILGASVAQIIATVLMVKLFQLKNYAIGVGLAKSEAILAAILGVAFFATVLTPIGWFGVILGAFAVFLLSGVRLRYISWPTLLLGLGSGLAFALTSLWVREASLLLAVPFPYSAAWVLLWVIATEAVMLVVWLFFKDKNTLRALLKRSKLTLLISIFSCIGSLGWFTAMSLESVALVKTLGQIEVLFSLLISVFFFKEKLVRTDHLGLLLIVIAAICVVWA